MEQKQLIDAICDALENVTQSVRTRKAKDNQPSKSDEYTFPNDTGDRWYKFEQITAEHRLDCDSLRDAPDALSLIVGGIVSTAVIDDQKDGRALVVEAFGKKYNNNDGVTIDLKSELSKKVKEVSVETVKKQTARLSVEQQKELAIELMKKHGITVDDLK